MNKDYSDIIDLPHHQSKTRPRMSNRNRAAQFAPFAALTGYAEAIVETARLTDCRIELDEYAKEELDRKLQIIAENIADLPEITVCYFVPDRKKEGGAYICYQGNIRRIDAVRGILIFADETEIVIDDIIYIDNRADV